MSDLGTSPARLWRKIYWRIIPVVGIAWLCSFIDRSSLGYVAVPLSKDLGLSATGLGFAAGVVFLGYILVPVPGNLIEYRVGARTWITCILIAWAMVTVATTAVDSAATLYLARIFLGFAEGGIGSGILLYLTFWIPRSQHSRALSYFFLVGPVSAITGALLASFLLSHDRLVLGLTGWRSVFLTEGILSLLVAVLVWFTLADKPQDASWLTRTEREMLQAELDRDAASAQAATLTSARAPFRDRYVWALAFAYFAISSGLSPLAFFLPKMITEVQHSLHNSQAVLITVIPQLIAAVAMIAWARLARRRTPAVATIIPATAAAVGIAVAAYASNGVIFVSAVCVALSGSYSAVPQFWRLPPLRLSGPATAAGVALIVSGGNLSAFAGPYVTGYAEDLTGNFRDVLLLVTAIMLLGVLTIAFVGRSALRTPPARTGTGTPPNGRTTSAGGPAISGTTRARSGRLPAPAPADQADMELAAGADAELGIYVAQVPFDRPCGQEQLGADLRIRPT
jgi:sugar phosphate permease